MAFFESPIRAKPMARNAQMYCESLPRALDGTLEAVDHAAFLQHQKESGPIGPLSRH